MSCNKKILPFARGGAEGYLIILEISLPPSLSRRGFIITPLFGKEGQGEIL
jgi:hypothetical protein